MNAFNPFGIVVLSLFDEYAWKHQVLHIGINAKIKGTYH
jgi:hypothetical protein